LYRIEFQESPEPGRPVLLEFADPAPAKAAIAAETALDAIPEASAGLAADALEVLAVPNGSRDEARWRKELRGWVGAGAVAAKAEDVLVLWRAGRAAIQGPAERLEAALLAVAEFAFYEAELRRLEAETAAAWPEAQDDTRLACDVTSSDVSRHKVLGRRTIGVFERRIRHARIESHLSQPAAELPPLARELGEVLREEAAVEDRLEWLDGKIEVYEYIYELASQRMAEYRNSRRERLLEIIIIAILLIETFAIWWTSPD
jgi:hypothetical protein